MKWFIVFCFWNHDKQMQCHTSFLPPRIADTPTGDVRHTELTHSDLRTPVLSFTDALQAILTCFRHNPDQSLRVSAQS